VTDSPLVRARKALASPELRWVDACIPKQHANNIGVIRHLLGYAATLDPKVRDSAAYAQCLTAMSEIDRERTLARQISEAWHDPKLRAEVGEARMEAALRDPETAYQELVGRSATGRLPPHLDAALKALGEARHYATDMGIPLAPGAPSAPVAVPSDKASIDSEYAQLVGESTKRRLSESEIARMTALKAEQIKREPAVPAGATPQETAAHRKALGLPESPPSEYQQLVQKSVSGLSPAEHSRMIELKGEQLGVGRAGEQGQATAGEHLAQESGNE
jgi:hypothetical protein